MLLIKRIAKLSITGVSILIASCGNNKDVEKNTIPAKVNFTEHVAPILYQNCTNCHRPGGTAHFSLVTYQQAKNYAASIAYVVHEHIMPPWPADVHYTQFVGERVLNDHDEKVLEKWVNDGAEEGPKNKLPKLPACPEGSSIGKPDLRIPVQPYFLKSNSSDRFLLIKVPFEFPDEKYASVIEFVPGRKNVVHHVNGDMVRYDVDKKKDVFAGSRIVDMIEDSTITLAYQKLDLPNDDASYPMLQKSVVNYLPGAYGQKYPDGIGGYILPRKGVFLLNDLHYGFTSKEDIWDSSYINIFFSKLPPNRPVAEFQLGTIGLSPVEPDLIIQPNTIKHVMSRFKVPFDISVLTINPHMHLLGQSFKGYALKTNGDTIRLISIPRWDFNWQYFYTFPKMVHIPKGSIIVAEGVYDNTTNNPLNPYSPPRVIQDRNGSMRATDEMFQFIITYLPYQQGDENIRLDVSKQ